MRKFIINDGYLKLANVEIHMQIAKNHDTTKGGGFWDCDKERKILFLWGTSIEYGSALKDDIIKALTEKQISNFYNEFDVYYSGLEDFSKDVKQWEFLLTYKKEI